MQSITKTRRQQFNAWAESHSRGILWPAAGPTVWLLHAGVGCCNTRSRREMLFTIMKAGRIRVLHRTHWVLLTTTPLLSSRTDRSHKARLTSTCTLRPQYHSDTRRLGRLTSLLQIARCRYLVVRKFRLEIHRNKFLTSYRCRFLYFDYSSYVSQQQLQRDIPYTVSASDVNVTGSLSSSSFSSLLSYSLPKIRSIIHGVFSE